LEDEKWTHSYYVSTLQLPSKRYFIEYYHQRGVAEVEQFREDKQGLYLAARRKGSFTGQQGYILLTDLVHNLLADFRHRALRGTRFADYGLKRIVRDLLHIPGRLHFDNQQLKRIELLKLNQNLIFVQSRRVLTFSFKLERFQLRKNVPNSTFPNKITGRPNFSFDLAV
jgi:hypothetical protein